jgi:RNA polymerase sigma factor (sigma-70 family)
MSKLPEGVSNEDVERALRDAHRYAVSRTRRCPALAEIATDAAVDEIVWRLPRFDEGRGDPFGAFVAASVKLFVGRAIARSAEKHATRPTHVDLDDTPVAAPNRSTHDDGRDVQLPEAVQELPAELRDSVRLFYLDGFDLRDIGLLMGCTMETVRRRLKLAARALSADVARPERKSGAKRMLR